MRELKIDHIVIGSGAAGLRAALSLYRRTDRSTALVTENMKYGTSRNTGSDKQTYYKISLAAGDPDSVRGMAEDLYSGGCVDGDLALCEAALSVRGFMGLVEAGVPFPCTEYGEYMGYKTDHDRGRRATSAGPYTSRMMTEALENEALRAGVPVLDHVQAVRILVKDRNVRGVLCVCTAETRMPDGAVCEKGDLLLIWAENVVLATGGPAGLYRDSVYPVSQLGSTGMALEAGAAGKNLTEWQYGIASLKPRWNVSGSYMQVVPAFISTDQEGNDPQQFLLPYFSTVEELAGLVFLKGYQWPFDVKKLAGGSSLIDLLVYQETALKGRRVWLDFTVNPGGAETLPEDLPAEAKQYLEATGALQGKLPIDRLRVLNLPAVRFYEEHGIDLSRERLEVAVCAQHNNGGIAADADWETEIRGLFVIGEACGSHGITRPGGTALNAGQVGALRAAGCILRRERQEKKETSAGSQGKTAFAAGDAADELRKEAEEFAALAMKDGKGCTGDTLSSIWKKASGEMSVAAGMIRDACALREAFDKTEEMLAAMPAVSGKEQLPMWFRLRDMLITRSAYLYAMLDYLEHGGRSRGSALYTDASGNKPLDSLDERFCFRLAGEKSGDEIQEIRQKEKSWEASWRKCRPVPEQDYVFETQWKACLAREG